MSINHRNGYRYDYCPECHKSTIKLTGEGHKLGLIYAWFCPKCKIYYIHDKLRLQEVRFGNLHQKVDHAVSGEKIFTKEDLQRQMGMI